MAHYDQKTNSWYVENICEPTFGMSMGPGHLDQIHSPDLCAGRRCIIHNPSDHHMRDWPVTWRADKGIAERTCPHGIGHPDPDDMAYHIEYLEDWYQGVHGCDGCCTKDNEAD